MFSHTQAGVHCVYIFLIKRILNRRDGVIGHNAIRKTVEWMELEGIMLSEIS
jgi:hypothetical protein